MDIFIPIKLEFEFREIEYNGEIYKDIKLGYDIENKPLYVNDIVDLRYWGKYVRNFVFTPCIIKFDNKRKCFYLCGINNKKHYFDDDIEFDKLKLIKSYYSNSIEEDERNK